MNIFKKTIVASILLSNLIVIPSSLLAMKRTADEITGEQATKESQKRQTTIFDYFPATNVNFTSLPLEVKTQILANLSDDELKNARLVNRKCKEIIDSIFAPQRGKIFARDFFVTLLTMICDESHSLQDYWEHLYKTKITLAHLPKSYHKFADEEFSKLIKLLFKKRYEKIKMIINKIYLDDLLNKFKDDESFCEKLYCLGLAIGIKISLLESLKETIYGKDIKICDLVKRILNALNCLNTKLATYTQTTQENFKSFQKLKLKWESQSYLFQSLCLNKIKIENLLFKTTDYTFTIMIQLNQCETEEDFNNLLNELLQELQTFIL